MAVFPSRLAYPAQYAADPIDVFVLGDTALRYGEFVGGEYSFLSSKGINAYYEEAVWDDAYGEYVNEGQPNFVLIAVNLDGHRKLIINASSASTYDSEGKVGWGASSSNSSSDTYTFVGTTTSTGFEFDISGQSTIYIKIYSRYYNVYVQDIRLE